MQSKHDVIKQTVDDVRTFMTLTSLNHCNQKKVRLKFSNFYAFLVVIHPYYCTDYAIGTNSQTAC